VGATDATDDWKGTPMSARTRILRAVATAVAAVLVSAAPATALPPGGAGGDTPGTAASVSPRSLAPGAVIQFTVSGFPAGETVYIKIDDGSSCSVDAAQGACVYHSQKLSRSGAASGSFALPSDLAAGPHWLRFLASREVKDAQGNFQGTEGFTHRGGADFTIVVPAAGGTSDTKGGDGTQGSKKAPAAAAPTTAAPGQAPVAGTSTVAGQGGVVTIEPQVEPTPTPAVTATSAVTPPPVSGELEPRSTEAIGPSASQEFPLIGVIGFMVMLLATCGLVGWSVRRASSAG
jgi:hypothetical protein